MVNVIWDIFFWRLSPHSCHKSVKLYVNNNDFRIVNALTCLVVSHQIEPKSRNIEKFRAFLRQSNDLTPRTCTSPSFNSCSAVHLRSTSGYLSRRGRHRHGFANTAGGVLFQKKKKKHPCMLSRSDESSWSKYNAPYEVNNIDYTHTKNGRVYTLL